MCVFSHWYEWTNIFQALKEAKELRMSFLRYFKSLALFQITNILPFLQLGLSKIANNRIGNRYDDLVGSGISGGELRRLAFAAEVTIVLLKFFIQSNLNWLDSHKSPNFVL